MISTGRALFLFLLLALSLSVGGQESTGTLTGTVKDKNTGELLFGAGIKLVGTYKGQTSDLDGRFVISGIKAGDYNIKVQYIGYSTTLLTGIRIEAGGIKNIEVNMLPAVENLQEVTVVGRQTQVNLELAASEISVSREQIEGMNSRDVQEVVALQAGVVKTQDGIQIRGARVYETEYIVDGISAQDPLAGTGFGVQVAKRFGRTAGYPDRRRKR